MSNKYVRITENPLLYMTEVLGVKSESVRAIVEPMTMLYDSFVYDKRFEDKICEYLNMTGGMSDSTYLAFLLSTMESVKYMHKEIIEEGNPTITEIKEHYHKLFAHIVVKSDALYKEIISVDPEYDNEMIYQYCLDMEDMVMTDLDNIFDGKRDSYIDFSMDYMDDCFDGNPVEYVYEKSPVEEPPKKKKKEKEDVVFDAIQKDWNEEVRKQVNSLDKIMDVDLKNPKKLMEDMADYENVLKFRVAQMYSVVAMLTHMDEKKFMKISKKGDVYLKDIRYKKVFSKSEMETEKQTYTNTLLFKMRFLARVVFWVAASLEDLVNVIFVTNGSKEFIEISDKLCILNSITETTHNLVYKMLNDIPCGQELSLIEYYMMYADDLSPKQVIKKMNTIDEQSALLSDRLKFHPFKKYDQSISMDTIMKLAYLTGTTQKNVKGVFEPVEKFKFHKKKMVREEIMYLGKRMRKAAKTKEFSMPLLFEYYMESKPVISSKWRDVNMNTDLAIGLCALSYYDFINGNKVIHKKLRKMTAA